MFGRFAKRIPERAPVITAGEARRRSAEVRTPALDSLWFLSLLLTAIVLGPALAHLFEFPNKIGLTADNYLAVQQIYRGWAWFGVVILAQVGSSFALMVILALRRAPTDVTLPVLVALLSMASAQVLFWVFTYPANLATENWTLLPAAWEQLREQWEYSHVAGAALNLIAMISLILSLLARD
jgi:hypothetical protein